MYAKIENDILHYAPSSIAEDGKIIYNPSDDVLQKYGYVPIVYTSEPEFDEEDPKSYIPVYEYSEDGKTIIQRWVEYAPEPEVSVPEVTIESRVSAIESAMVEQQQMNTDLLEATAELAGMISGVMEDG